MNPGYNYPGYPQGAPHPNHQQAYQPGQPSHSAYGYPTLPPGAYPNPQGYTPHQPQQPHQPHQQAYYPHHAPYQGYPQGSYPVFPHPHQPAQPHPTQNYPKTNSQPTPPKPEVVELKDWIPSSSERQQIDSWFDELDKNSGFIGGAEAVVFLKSSNLPKETLRSIWSYVDSNKRGSIDRRQFYNVIRFVSIAISPIYAGSVPSIELYNESLYQSFTLPQFTTKNPAVTISAVEPVKSQPTGMSALDAMAEELNPVPTIPIPPLQDVVKNESPPNSHAYPNGYYPHPSQHYHHPHGHEHSHQPHSQHHQIHYVPYPPQYQGQPPDYYPAHYLPNSPGHQSVPQYPISQPPTSNHANDEEFSDFASADVPASNVVPVHIPISTQPNQQAVEDDEFSDFTSASTTSNTVSQEQTSKNLESIIISNDVEFSNFSSAPTNTQEVTHSKPSLLVPPSLPDPQSVPANVTESIPPVTTSSISLPNVSAALNSGMSLPNNNIIISDSKSKLSIFDDMVEMDLSVAKEEWDEFTEAPATPLNQQSIPHKSETGLLAVESFQTHGNQISANITIPASTVQQTITKDEDFFGDFNTSDSAKPNNDESNILNNTVRDEDQFGDFSDTQVSQINTSISMNAGVLNSQFSTENLIGSFNSLDLPTLYTDINALNASSSIQSAFNHIPPEQAEDLFGDFDTGSSLQQNGLPVNISVSNSKVISEDLFGEFNDIAPVPSLSHDISSMASKPSNDFLDPFKTSLPTVPLSISNDLITPTIDADFEADFGDFHSSNQDLLSLGNSHALVQDNLLKDSMKPSIVVQSSSMNLYDNFPSPVQSSLNGQSLTMPSSYIESPLKQTVVEHYLSTFSSKQAKEYESLSYALLCRGFADISWQSYQQASKYEEYEKLKQDKASAVDRDDLEAAVSIKNQMTNVSKSLSSNEDELHWKSLAGSSSKNQTGQSTNFGLEEDADIISAYDTDIAQKFSKQYIISSNPSSTISLDQLITRILSAKRSFRLILTLYTSHTNHANYWANMLQEIAQQLKQASIIFPTSGQGQSSFMALSESDKLVCRTHQKFITYVDGLYALIEAGEWLIPTCEHCFVHSSLTASVRSTIEDVIVGLAIAGLDRPRTEVISSSSLAVKSTPLARDGASFCNLTFQPLDGFKAKLHPDTIRQEGKTYLKSAYNLFRHLNKGSSVVSDVAFLG